MDREMPRISTSAHTHAAYSMGDVGTANVPLSLMGVNFPALGRIPSDDENAALLRRQINQQKRKEEVPMSQARVVKVYVADPNENLPLEKRVLYTGEEKLTDLTDQELFFEIPMQDLLAKHNAFRKGVLDRKQGDKFGRDIYLDPVKIRDLRMVVVTVATF